MPRKRGRPRKPRVKKNRTAVTLGKLRWAGTTPEQRREAMDRIRRRRTDATAAP